MGEGSKRNILCSCGSGLKYKNCCSRQKQLSINPKTISKGSKEILGNIMDSVTKQYREDENIIYKNESELNKNFYGLLKKHNKRWERTSCCLYPECINPSIRRSHTIPKSCIGLITEDDHVLTPCVINGELKIEEIGVNKASTFPGFCIEHENSFQIFEKYKDLKEQSDYALQILRTICREIAIKEHQLRNFKEIKSHFINQTDEWGKEAVKREFKKRFILKESVKFEKFSIELEGSRIVYIDEKIKSIQDDINNFKNTFLKPYEIAFRTGMLDLSIRTLDIDINLSIALSGRGNIIFQKEKKSKESNEVQLILNVIPTVTGTKIFIAVPSAHDIDLNNYIGHFIRSVGPDHAILSMIQSWMLFGSDHWFITPSIWSRLSFEVQNEIISQIMSTDHNIGFVPDIDIFKDLYKDINII